MDHNDNIDRSSEMQYVRQYFRTINELFRRRLCVSTSCMAFCLLGTFLKPYYKCNISKNSALACARSSLFFYFPGYCFLGQPSLIHFAPGCLTHQLGIYLMCRKLYHETTCTVALKENSIH